jgi:carboxyl-terminal processing protease
MCIGRLFFLCVISICGSVCSEELSSSYRKVVHRSIEDMLDYHVEYKTFSPLLAKRSLKLFFEQFDPYKIYLLQSEVASLNNMTEEHLEDVIRAHQRSGYSVYEQADELLISSIIRARQYREQVKNEVLKEGSWDLIGTKEPYSSFPKTEEGLFANLKKQMLYVLQAEKMEEGYEKLEKEDVEKILVLFEKRLRASEESYLAKDGGKSLAMRILKAFAKSLDAHTSFFTPEEAAELRMNLEKQFEGIGVVFREGILGIVVKEIVAKSPADKSGKIAVGDILVSVDNKPVAQASYQEVMQWLKGEKGRKVVLGVQKRGGGVEVVTLTREKVVMSDERIRFTSYPYGDGIIGLIDLPSFYENGDGISAERDMKEALKALKASGKLHGLVIDVRDNSGGFLSQAVKVSGLFMSGGVVVISKYSQGQMQYLREIDGRIFYDGPLVFLTSKVSASATEIVLQSLQDYGIAIVVGDERTYGKGTIQYQTVTEEKVDTHFKVTVGKYYTVSGRSTQIEGVKADITVPTIYAPFNIGEKYLPYPLKNDQVPPAFIDPLLDVDSRSRAWLQKNYMPNLQKRLSIWTEMLTVLKSNSENRLLHNQDFLSFLRWTKTQSSDLAKESWFGKEDLQINEAIEIVKDMSLLQKYGKKQAFLRK